MKYSNYIKNPDTGKMVHKDDVRKLARIMTDPHWTSKEIFVNVRGDLIDMHGYDYYRDTQNVAFLALFSSLEEYTNILKKD